MNTQVKCKDATLIAFDLETTGKYPLGAEICEMAAVKWRNGQILGQFQTLIRPSVRMSEEVIKIHHITNEMVQDSPKVDDKIREFYDFIQDGFMVAHHAPFDLGFLAIEFEKKAYPLPPLPVLCSSLISRQVIKDVENHKMKTLAEKLGLDQGQSHRALDDASACLQLTLKCFEKFGEDKTIEEVIALQGQKLTWDIFSMDELKQNPVFVPLIDAIEDKASIEINYAGGSKPGKFRKIYPEGIVRRSVVDDFLVAKSAPGDQHPKRFFLKNITDVKN